jgi:5-methylcytosine-specific restriction endonuclease McrA
MCFLVYFSLLCYFYEFTEQFSEKGRKYDFEPEIFADTHAVNINGAQKLNGKLSGKVLVLNQNYEAMSICNVQRAVVLIFLGKAELISSKDTKKVRSVRTAIPFPTIVRLRVYIKVPYKKIVLSRKNILRRDNHKCQYCSRADVTLTIDHIVPRSKDGDDTWENLVTACVKCNNKKGDRSPEEAKMQLVKKPSKPSHITFMKHFVGRVDDDWRPYLYMN